MVKLAKLQRNIGATTKLPEDVALNQQVQQDQPTAQNEDETDEENTYVKNSQLSPTVTQAPVTALNEQVTTPTAETNGTAESDEAKEVTASPTANVTPSASNVVRVFGTFQASQLAQRRIQSLVMQSLRGYSTNDTILMNQRTLTNITNHHAFQMPPFMNSYHHHQGPHPHQQNQQHNQHQLHQQKQRNDYQIQHQPRLNGQNVYNNNNRRNNRQQQNKPDVKSETNSSVAHILNGTTLSTNEQLQQQPVQQTSNCLNKRKISSQIILITKIFLFFLLYFCCI